MGESACRGGPRVRETKETWPALHELDRRPMSGLRDQTNWPRPERHHLFFRTRIDPTLKLDMLPMDLEAEILGGMCALQMIMVDV